MFISTFAIAYAAERAVPDDYTSLEDALTAAAPGDVIKITSAGTYEFASAGEGTHTGSLTITSTVSDHDDVILTGAFVNFGDLTIEHAWLSAGSSRVRVDGSLTIDDARVSGTGSQLLVIAGNLRATSVQVRDLLTTSTTVFDVIGSYDLQDIVLRNTNFTTLVISNGDGAIRHLDARCSTATVYVNNIGGGRLDLNDSLVASTGGMLAANGSGTLTHITLSGLNGTAALLGGPYTLTDSVIQDGTALFALPKSGAKVTATRSVWYNIADPFPDGGGPSSGLTEVNPKLSTVGDPCEDGYWPKFGSPLVDAGDPADTDLDDSRADIGASGGSTALDFVPDVDADGVNASRDCDDLDPARAPTFVDSVGDTIDQDCDGTDGVDFDHDGHASTASGGDDCVDTDRTRNPGATDTVGNSIDENCDDADGVDADGDDSASQASGGDDCADDDPSRHPGLTDMVGDAVDQNCDGADGVDADGDTHATAASGGDDCDDTDATIFPGATEKGGDGIDSNCDGADGTDSDGDGTVNADDCGPDDATIHPGATDAAGDSIDQDCDGSDGVDGDGDAHASTGSGGDDCDDANPEAFPGATEDKGGEDLDCDGEVNPPCGCQSAGSPATMGLFGLLAGLVLRRRGRR